MTSIFLKSNEPTNSITTFVYHEILAKNNDIFSLNRHLIRENPKLDSATIIVLKRSLFYKDNWCIRFLFSHEIKVNGVLLKKGEELILIEKTVITIYEHDFFICFDKETFLKNDQFLDDDEKESTPDVAPIETFSPLPKIKQVNLPENSQFTPYNLFAQSDETNPFSIIQTKAAQAVEVNFQSRYFTQNGESDVLKELEIEYHTTLLDPDSLTNAQINKSVFEKNKNFVTEDFFTQGQLLAEESTEDLIDGKLNIDEIEVLLGSDFNDELFKSSKNDDILMLYATKEQKEQQSKKQLPSLNRKDYYSIGLRSPLREIGFYTQTAQSEKDSKDKS